MNIYLLINLHRNLHEKSSFLSEIMFIQINPYVCHYLTCYQSNLSIIYERCVRKKGVPIWMSSFFNASKAANAITPNARVKSTLCVPSAPFSRYQGTSLTTANPSSCRKYFIRFRVYWKPSAMRKANTGKAMRPKQRMTS